MLRPRTSTAGMPSSACPITSEAAAATSSANPISVARKVRPKRSGRPRRSISAGSPAAPAATPTVPRRHARPQLSLTITPMRLPKCAPSRSRSAAAEPSGSRGSSSTGSAPIAGSTLDWSTPALAVTKPRRCSTISALARWRTTRCDSPRMTSTSRGSLSTSAARLTRARRRPDLAKIDVATLGLRDDLLRHHQDVLLLEPQGSRPRAPRSAARRDHRPAARAARSGPGSARRTLFSACERSDA